MNVLVLLAAILLLLMVLVGGKKGARSFISLFLNFGVLFLAVFFMLDPRINPIIITLIACALISCIILFYINSVNSKTKTAFVSTVITIGLLLVFIYVITKKAMIQGFGEEQIEELSVYSLHIGVDFVKVGASMIIMSTIGAITDTAISITSPMREVFYHHPDISRNALFMSGVRIGRDILGSNVNTLFFAFLGSYLALLIWFKDMSYSFGEVINSKVFNMEMVIILCSGIGIALVIPIAAWINAHYLVKTEGNQSDR